MLKTREPECEVYGKALSPQLFNNLKLFLKKKFGFKCFKKGLKGHNLLKFILHNKVYINPQIAQKCVWVRTCAHAHVLASIYQAYTTVVREVTAPSRWQRRKKGSHFTCTVYFKRTFWQQFNESNAGMISC